MYPPVSLPHDPARPCRPIGRLWPSFINACTEEKSSLVRLTIDNYLSKAESSSLVQRFRFNWLDWVAIFLQTVFYNQSIIIFHRDKLEPDDRLSEKSYLNYTKNNCQTCHTLQGQYHPKKYRRSARSVYRHSKKAITRIMILSDSPPVPS